VADISWWAPNNPQPVAYISEILAAIGKIERNREKSQRFQKFNPQREGWAGSIPHAESGEELGMPLARMALSANREGTMNRADMPSKY